MNYLIFGAGRVGGSLAAYLRALGHQATLVSRRDVDDNPGRCRTLIGEAQVVAAATPDKALPAWAAAWRGALAGKEAIHFSGALLIDGVRSYHPLYSFPTTPLAPKTMRSIAFAREEGARPLAEIIPGAPNPDFVVADADRAFYHALAVLSGNFAAHIWNETAKGFSERLGIAPDVIANYLESIVHRYREHPLNSMTGPVARRDRSSVDANLSALKGEPKLKALYEAFLESAWLDKT